MRFCKKIKYLNDILLITRRGRIFRKNNWFKGGWRELTPTVSEKGYLLVKIRTDEYDKKGKCKYKKIRVHRLVALAFIPNPKKFPLINHKDENKQNNFVENLEWCTALYNIRYSSTKNKNLKNSESYNVIEQYDIQGNKISEYNSISEASKINNLPYLGKKFRAHLDGKSKILYGYVWKVR